MGEWKEPTSWECSRGTLVSLVQYSRSKRKTKNEVGGLRRKMKTGVVPLAEEYLPTKGKAKLKPQYKNGVCV
jgi:hypothetical protein